MKPSSVSLMCSYVRWRPWLSQSGVSCPEAFYQEPKVEALSAGREPVGPVRPHAVF